jgi:hypothetical protein
LKNFPGVIPRTPVKGEGRKGKGGRKGERRGLEIQMGRRGVLWNREGEEGTELGGLYRGEGWEGGKRWLAPKTKFLDPPLDCLEDKNYR